MSFAEEAAAGAETYAVGASTRNGRRLRGGHAGFDQVFPLFHFYFLSNK
jgi:hypothetical protein